MVFFLTEGQKISKRFETQPGGWNRVLESNRSRQTHRKAEDSGNQEGTRFLRWQSSTWHQDQLDHARVPPRQCGSLRFQTKQQQLQGNFLFLIANPSAGAN